MTIRIKECFAGRKESGRLPRRRFHLEVCLLYHYMKFIDDVTLALIASAAGLWFVIIVGSGWGQQEKLLDGLLENHREKAWPFLGVGAIMLSMGYPIVWFWPLQATLPPSGNANIVIGWPLVWFGLVFLMTGRALGCGHGKSRRKLFWICGFAAWGGLMNLILAIGILKSGIGHPPLSEDGLIQEIFSPPLWAFAYFLSGLAALLSPLALCLKWPRLMKGARLAMGICLMGACFIFALAGCGTLISHIELFKAFPSATSMRFPSDPG